MMKLSILTLCVLSASAFATTTSTVPSSADVMIFADSTYTDTTMASGKGPAFFAGADGSSNKKRSLIKFDLSGATPAIPGTATVTSVTLELVLGQVAGSGGGGGGGGGCGMGCTYPTRTIRLYASTRAWSEGNSGSPTSPTIGGTGQGYTRGTGDSTWNYANYSSSTWTNTGGDYNATELTHTDQTVFSLGTIHTWTSSSMITQVNNWRANSATNLGWELISDLEGNATPTSFLGWWSRDGQIANPTQTYMPLLSITWM